MAVVEKAGEAVPDGQALDLLKELQVFQGGLPLEDKDAEEFGFFRGKRIPAAGHQGQALPPRVGCHRISGSGLSAGGAAGSGSPCPWQQASCQVLIRGILHPRLAAKGFQREFSSGPPELQTQDLEGDAFPDEIDSTRERAVPR